MAAAMFPHIGHNGRPTFSSNDNNNETNTISNNTNNDQCFDNSTDCDLTRTHHKIIKKQLEHVHRNYDDYDISPHSCESHISHESRKSSDSSTDETNVTNSTELTMISLDNSSNTRSNSRNIPINTNNTTNTINNISNNEPYCDDIDLTGCNGNNNENDTEIDDCNHTDNEMDNESIDMTDMTDMMDTSNNETITSIASNDECVECDECSDECDGCDECDTCGQCNESDCECDSWDDDCNINESDSCTCDGDIAIDNVNRNSNVDKMVMDTDNTENTKNTNNTLHIFDKYSNNNNNKYSSDCDCNDYLVEILYNLLKQDDQSLTETRKYLQFESEKESLQQYRQQCIQYMHCWYKQFKLNINSFSLAIDILHRLMGELYLTQTNVMLVAFAILYIATKYHENDDSHSKARLLFTNALSNDASKVYREAILKLEMQFLQNLNFKLTVPSTVLFADIFVSLFGFSLTCDKTSLCYTDNKNKKDEIIKRIRNQVYIILETAIINMYTVYYKPSMVAAICVKHVISTYKFGSKKTKNTNTNTNTNTSEINENNGNCGDSGCDTNDTSDTGSSSDGNSTDKTDKPGKSDNDQNQLDFSSELKKLEQCLSNENYDKSINQSKTGQKIANLINYFTN